MVTFPLYVVGSYRIQAFCTEALAKEYYARHDLKFIMESIRVLRRAECGAN